MRTFNRERMEGFNILPSHMLDKAVAQTSPSTANRAAPKNRCSLGASRLKLEQCAWTHSTKTKMLVVTGPQCRPWYSSRGTDLRMSGSRNMTLFMTSGPRMAPMWSEQLSKRTCRAAPRASCMHTLASALGCPAARVFSQLQCPQNWQCIPNISCVACISWLSSSSGQQHTGSNTKCNWSGLVHCARSLSAYTRVLRPCRPDLEAMLIQSEDLFLPMPNFMTNPT